ncbi:glycosyltransferase [Phreatobacter sp.]|uniref:glycosyltransferase n=1 Tax=Phreatobacter sp. TaxID=1966341 RepID=UPI003F6FCEB1
MTRAETFAVNGRFLTQSVTGVQRYARNVVAALDVRLGAAGQTAPLIAPPGAADPRLTSMPLVEAGPLSGHAWEQTVLPLRWPGRLVNLCNTAPAAHRDQIVCIHDGNVFAAPGSYSKAFRLLYSRLQRLLVRRAARISTVSNTSARQLARYLSLRVEDIAVLPNGHEHALDWNPAAATHAPQIVAPLGERPFVLALGSRARHKNLQLLADIAPALDEIGLGIVIAGGEAGIFAPEALTRAPNMILAGRVSDDDLAWLMDRALCLAFPSWTEGFGLPLVEAMARGCPVVSSDRSSMPEVCGTAGLMAGPDDPAAWVRQIRLLAEAPALRQEMAGRGLERVRRYSWSDTAAGYLDLVHEPVVLPTRRLEPLPQQTRVAVIVASLGRPEVVTAMVRHLLATQTLTPETVIVSTPTVADAGELVDEARVQVVTGPAGLPRQRNAALAALGADIDVVAFFDDDFVPDRNWLAVAARTFRDEAEIVGFTGRVLADGIKGPGIPFDEAVRIVADEPDRADWTCVEPYSPYGCNMAFRASSIRGLKFDERLVLYGWLEDRDFGASLARRGGRLVKCEGARGVHMGVKGGRVMGDRLGYSQVVNPIYMLRKGTMTLSQVADHVLRNVGSNVARSARPEPFVDRRGRLRGNALAFRDLVRGRIEPERAAEITIGPRVNR